MEDTVSSRLSSWEGTLTAPAPHHGVDGFLILLSAYTALGLCTFLLFVFCGWRKNLGLLLCCGAGQLKGFQNVRTFLFALLALDVIHVMMTLSYLLEFSLGERNAYSLSWLSHTHSVWILSRYFTVVLHLCTALISIYYLCDPAAVSRMRCISPVFYVFNIFVLLLACGTIYLFLSPDVVIVLGPVTIGLIFAIIYKNGFSTASKWRTWIVFVATVSFSIAFLPSFILHFLVITRLVDVAVLLYYYLQFATNIQLFLDALLCFFILKLNVAEEPSRQRPNHVLAAPRPERRVALPAYDNIEFTTYGETSFGGHFGHSGGRGGGRD
ncbi:uncharacterized protein V6R79_020392 [Siganus canaliculatus]